MTADPGGQPDRPDLRMIALGVAAWAGGLAAVLMPSWVVGAMLATGLATGFGAVVASLARRRARPDRGPGAWRPLVVGCVLVGGAVAAGIAVRAEAHVTGPVSRLAQEHAVVAISARVSSDPVTRTGRFGDYVVVRVVVLSVVGRGHDFTTRVPVLVIGDETWSALPLGSTIEGRGRLDPSDDAAVAAVLAGSPDPVTIDPPAAPLVGAEAVRAGIRDAVRGSPDARALVPALVVGDDRRMSPEVVADFRTCGLTHLAAVSGTNLTLVVGFLVVVARGLGVRGRLLTGIGLVGVVGFVVLARPEPSVVRAAAMGSVALLSMGHRGRARGARALGVATVVLLLVDPWLVVSAGFALSVLATAGILFLAPALRDRMRRWLPRWAAEAVAVPLAAQLACTPVVAALSGEVSLVAVAANMLVAPAVAPATVLGLLGGLVGLVAPTSGALLGLAAGASGGWIVLVAHHLARLPTASVEWGAAPGSLLVLTLGCVAMAWWSGWVLGRRRRTALGLAVLALVVIRPLPAPGWPPDGWVLAACDVGQGDALVLNAGAGTAVVVDVGPDPEAIGRCLARLEVRDVPVVVLTHFHADHVEGLSGVLDSFEVDTVITSNAADPAAGAESVQRLVEGERATLRAAGQGETTRVGGLTWQVLGPPATPPPPGEQGSAANNASVVLLVEVAGVRILLTGDIEPEAQAAVARAAPGLRVDVLKVPHHGSRHQDVGWLAGLQARLVVVSVGAGNDYGHPDPGLLDVLAAGGALVRRTDSSGDLVVVVDDERRLRLRTAS